MKKLIVLLLVLCLILPGCKSKSGLITTEDAQKIVLEDLGVSADQATIHVHIGSGDVPSYVVYATVGGHTMEYVIRAADGEILSVTESSHSH